MCPRPLTGSTNLELSFLMVIFEHMIFIQLNTPGTGHVTDVLLYAEPRNIRWLRGKQAEVHS